MSKSVHYRLPDQLLLDVQGYARLNGVSVTDVIIQGLNVILGEGMKGQTVYESDAVKPVKIKKRPIDVAPIVNAMLSGVKVKPAVAHHSQCKCGVCKE